MREHLDRERAAEAEALVRAALARAATATDEQFDALNAAVRFLSVKEVAHRLDISGSFLSNSLARRGENYLRVSFEAPILALSPRDMARAAIQPLADLHGFDLVDRPTMTPEQELAALRAAMAATLGGDVCQLVESKVRAGK